MSVKAFVKQNRIHKTKAVTINDSELEKINQFAIEPLTAEQVYAQKFLMAHNAIDRDNERFGEDLLNDFAETYPGKSFLMGHERPKPGEGLFYESYTEEMTPEQFEDLTKEDPKLPEGIEKVKALWTKAYFLNINANEKLIANLKGGVYRHSSIGFSASDLKPVTDGQGRTLYFEYVAPGEATEGSLVWLGAQQGAGGYKAPKDKNKDRSGEMNFKTLIAAMIGLGMTGLKGFDNVETEEDFAKKMKAVFDEKEDKIKELQTENESLKTMAEEGKKFRKQNEDEYIRLKALLGDIPKDEDKQKSAKTFVQKMDTDFLQMELKSLQARAEKENPDEFQTKGDDRRDKSGDTPGEGEKNPLSTVDEKKAGEDK